MYSKDSFQDVFHEWRDQLDEGLSEEVEFDHFDRSIHQLFIERSENFTGEEAQRALDDLREMVRSEDDDVRVSTLTMPEENKIRDEI